MINREDSSISIINENGNFMKVYLLFGFEIKELNKKYIAYTSDMDNDKDQVNVLISEIDSETNKIKSIPSNEMAIVKEFYNEAKRQILEN